MRKGPTALGLRFVLLRNSISGEMSGEKVEQGRGELGPRILGGKTMKLSMEWKNEIMNGIGLNKYTNFG